MRSRVLFVCLGLLITAAVVSGRALYAQSSTAQTPVSELQRPIYDCQRQVNTWHRAELVEIVFIVIALSLGAIISALQASKSPRAKPITIVLGVITAILTGVNATLFPADVKTLRRAELDGSAVIRQLWVKVQAAENQNSSSDDRKTATADYLKELDQFHAVEDKLNGTVTAAKLTEIGLPVVYAQSQTSIPSWAQNGPPGGSSASLFFVGKASDTSLTVAKQDSMDDALYNAAASLLRSAPNVSRSALLDLIKSSGVVQNSAFAYNAKAGLYEYYTLFRLSPEIQNIVAKLPPAPAFAATTFPITTGQPADLTFSAPSGLLLLGSDGTVSRLDPTHPGSPAEKLFKVRGSDSAYALTANAEAVFVVATSKIGCNAYKYSLASKQLTNRLFAVRERCVGIANDGKAIYLTFPDRKEIRHWESWDALSFNSWAVDETGSPGYVVYDNAGQRLIVADDSGRAYAVSTSDGKKRLLSENLGAVASIAISRFHILIASGKKVLFLARSDNHGENPPIGWPTLPGGNITGVAVDDSDHLWLSAYENKIVEGPFPLI